MTSPSNSHDGALIQIGRALGQIEARLAAMQTAQDHLIRILQQATPSKTSNPEEKPASPPSLLASLLEKVSRKVLMDITVMLAKKIAASALPYIIPWSVFLGGLAWLGKGLLRFLGLS